MSIKLFATDLDGTLLNKNGEISPANKQAIKEMAKEGIIPTIATGRMYEASRRFAEQLELDVPIITYNGALIKSVSGNVYFEGFLPPKIVSEIYDYCKEMKYYFQTYQDDKLYYETYTDKTKGYEEGINIKGYAIGEKVYELVDRIPKILIITTSNEESDEVARLFNEKFSGQAHAAKSQFNYVEIMAPNISKASGLHHLAEKLGLGIDEVMAIGDANNDVPMLKVAGFSAVMGSAKDDVKACGDVVVGDCEHDGVAEAIYKYVLKKDI